MSSRFHNNAIYVQLDLLFEFCQWAIRAFRRASQPTHLTLYRGINSFDEHQIVERINKHAAVVRLNNLTSFSSDRDTAGCFGDTILTARIPVSKIAFFNALVVHAPAERRRRISGDRGRMPRDRPLSLIRMHEDDRADRGKAGISGLSWICRR